KQLVRGNFHWTNDQIQQSNFQQARLFAKNDSWQISDRMEGKHRPSLFSAAIFWEIKIRPTTMFHYKGNVEQQQSLSEWLQQMNDRQQVSSIVISQNCSQQHQLEWITRFNEHTALRSRFFCSDYQQVQSLGIIPVNPTSIDSSFLQQVLARKQVLKWQHMIQGKLGASLYRVEAGWQWQKAAMETLLEKTFAAENVILPVAQNQLWSRQQQFYIEGSTSARAGRFLFKPLLRLSAFQWTFLIAEKHRQQKFFMPFEPELTIVQKISSSLSWIHHVEYSFRPTGVEQLYPQSVQIAPRYLQQYEGNAEPQQWWIANTTLVLNDFFRQLNAEAGLRYIAHKGIIIPQLLLNPMVMHTRFRFVPLTQSVWQFNAQAEKFIPLFKSTIKARIALNQSNYYNSVDSQLLRRNQSRHYEGELSGQTRINEQWSFSASMKLIYFTVKQGGMQVQNNRMAFHNFKCLWRPVKTMQWMVSASYYQPQWGRGAGLWLADALMRYQPKEKRWRFSFSGRNILDRRFYRETEVSDYAFIQQVTPLMPASWSAELEWRF
ncbi:MAG: TonB-dependent receptor, partial [Bacteroidetes bacterium]|nr:TonB-dependent receptor [Bacteroidota bacterium]